MRKNDYFPWRIRSVWLVSRVTIGSALLTIWSIEFSRKCTKLSMLSFLYCLCRGEQNNFSKKPTSSRDWTWDPRTMRPLVCYSLMSPHWASTVAGGSLLIFNFTCVGAPIDFWISSLHKDLKSVSLTSSVKLAQWGTLPTLCIRGNSSVNKNTEDRDVLVKLNHPRSEFGD